ncbi:hypothetical protein PAHAL_3G188900 [Panicum hallii]|jgi:hypothetical protein|uniref:Uncharacterized protein n=1 Tax=Panicum hallii TaxID=206008 RepID=A0A2T8KIM7_9POAL|nr:hypothetical protein PAHAL_3G188900 [Panicum hallii]
MMDGLAPLRFVIAALLTARAFVFFSVLHLVPLEGIAFTKFYLEHGWSNNFCFYL